MNKHLKGFLLGMMLCVMLAMSAVACAAADPIRVSSLSEPQSVISEQDVSITIKIYNSSQTDMEEEITLFNPEGISVEKYSGLKSEQSVTYTGKWYITKEQIEKGKVNYYIQYTVDTGDGPQKATRTVPVTIQTEELLPQLTATYSVTPTSAREGQTVTFAYTLSNTGNVALKNIEVSNSGVTKEKLTHSSLAVGEKVTLTGTVKMGKKEMVSKPSISYQASGNKKTLTIDDMAKKTITVAKNGLDVNLVNKNTTGVYPGETMTLTVEMKNTTSQAYKGLRVVLNDGTEAVASVDLGAGASVKKEFTWTATENAELTATVTGTDHAGEEMSVVSNTLSVATLDASRALLLNVYADVAETVIYSEPAVIRFGVRVQNVGQTDAATLTIEQGGTTVAKIPSLPAGESRTVVFDLETSMAGQFQFTVKGNDADGNARSYPSNILQVAYVAPTPVPTPVPTPTPVPPTPSPVPTATPAPTLGEMIAAKVNMTVLYAIAGVLALALAIVLGISGVSSAKRKKRMAGALDTIELSANTRNYKGHSHRAEKPKQDEKQEEKKNEKPVEETVMDMPEEESILVIPQKAEPEIEPEQEDVSGDKRRRRAVQETVEEAVNIPQEMPSDEKEAQADDAAPTRLYKLDSVAAKMVAEDEDVEMVSRVSDLLADVADGESTDEVKKEEQPTKKKGWLFGKKQKTKELDEDDEEYDSYTDDFDGEDDLL